MAPATKKRQENFASLILEVADAGSLRAFFEHWPMSFHHLVTVMLAINFRRPSLRIFLLACRLGSSIIKTDSEHLQLPKKGALGSS